MTTSRRSSGEADTVAKQKTVGDLNATFDQDNSAPMLGARRSSASPMSSLVPGYEPDAGTGEREMTKDEMLGLALISLVTPLVGGALGGREGAMAGGASGLKAASGAASQMDADAKEESKFKRTLAAKDADRKQDLGDRMKLQEHAAGLKPEQRGRVMRNAEGQLIDVDARETVDETKTPPKPGKVGAAGGKPTKLQQTTYQDKDGNPLSYNPETNEYVAAKAPGAVTKAPPPIEQTVEKLGKDLQSGQESLAAISAVEGQLGFKLEEFDPKTGTVGGKPVDLPGISVPVVGRISGYDTEARTLQSRAAKVFNTELKDRSGAAVTDSELERLKTEFAAGKYNTEEELIGALRDYKAAAIRAMKNQEARYSPAALEAYEKQGGATSKAASGVQNEAPKITPEDDAAKTWAEAESKKPEKERDPNYGDVVGKLRTKGLWK